MAAVGHTCVRFDTAGILCAGSYLRDRQPGLWKLRISCRVFFFPKDAPGTETERGDATRQRASESE